MLRSVTGVAILCASLFPAGGAAVPPVSPVATATTSPAHCTPKLPCWPSPGDWAELRATLVGAPSPLQSCVDDPNGAACTAATRGMTNPFYHQDQPGGTESLGWIGAWTAAPSAYAIAAEAPSDVVAAVDFARGHHLCLVIKGTGHDYLGRSSAPDSLLVWTHKMRKVTVTDAFTPRGCAPPRATVPAVTVEAGARWVEAYDAVTVHHGRYVQGGGCTSVGAAGGFLQGGGFGSWSKKYGVAAAGMLEAEGVTAAGELRVANACQNEDLFWALRGGGGGTFGVVTKVTLMTHPLPSTFGHVEGTLEAKNDAAFKELLVHFVDLAGRSLTGESWGESVNVCPNDTLHISMAFEGMSADEAKQVWAPLRQWLDQHAELVTGQLRFYELPGTAMWNSAILGKHPVIVESDTRPGPQETPSGGRAMASKSRRTGTPTSLATSRARCSTGRILRSSRRRSSMRRASGRPGCTSTRGRRAPLPKR